MHVLGHGLCQRRGWFVTSLKRLLVDINGDPFLREEFRSDPSAVLGRYRLSDEARAAVLSGKQAEIWRAMQETIAKARPQNANLAMTGVQVWAWPDLVDAKDCARLRDVMGAATLEKAQVWGAAGPVHDPSIWRAHLSAVGWDTVLEIAGLINALAPPIAAAFAVDIAACEPPVFVSYKRNGHLAKHGDRADGVQVGQPGTDRVVTAILYLDEPQDPAPERAHGRKAGFSGGGLRIYPGQGSRGGDGQSWDITPKQGMLLAFRATQQYEIRPVASGRLRVITAWLLGPSS